MKTAFFGSAGPAVSPVRSTKVLPRVTAPVSAHVDTHIDVQTLSATQWRVCDTRWPEYDARNLLGFIEKRADQFEVVQVFSGLKRFSFRSLAEAARHFSRGTESRQ